MVNGHFQPSWLGVIVIAGLLPAAYVAPQLSSLIAQPLLGVDSIAVGVGLNPSRVNRYSAQLAQAHAAPHLQNLPKRIVQRPCMAPAKRTQRPVIYPLLSPQITQRQVLYQTTFQLPRARNAQCIPIKPNAQHQLRSVKCAPLGTIGSLENAQIKPLHYTAN